MKKLCGIPLLLALAGCNAITAPCEDIERDGILLTIVDSATLGPVLADSIMVKTTDGSYTDSLRFTNLRPDPVTWVGLAPERRGVYDIQIVATGYRVWERDGIRVTSGRCHVNTVRVTASMQRSG